MVSFLDLGPNSVSPRRPCWAILIHQTDRGLDLRVDRRVDCGVDHESPVATCRYNLLCHDAKCPTKTFVVIKIRYLEVMAEVSKFITLFITVD